MAETEAVAIMKCELCGETIEVAPHPVTRIPEIPPYNPGVVFFATGKRPAALHQCKNGDRGLCFVVGYGEREVGEATVPEPVGAEQAATEPQETEPPTETQAQQPPPEE